MFINNLFGEIPEKSVVFVIDTSGSMYDVLAAVKDHIAEVLIDRAYNRPGTTFNIIEFSSETTQWADRMVECTPITVNAATRWLRGIESQIGSDMLQALEMAFDEPRCEAVYMLTDGMPDQEPNEIVYKITKASQGRPLHCITVTDGSAEVPIVARTFLEDLSLNTRGSFHIVQVSRLGDVKKVNEMYNATYTPVEGKKSCSVEASLTHNPYLNTLSTIPPTLPPHLPYYRYAPFAYTEAFKEALERNPVASVVARGTKVLARRDEDGFYYVGHIAQDVTGRRNRFLIEFDRTKKGRDLRMQETALHDMIALNDALRHNVVADDKVIAPWEENGKRYGPGKVIRGVEKRHSIGDPKDSDLLVTFWNGKTVNVSKGVAVWIPNLLYDRVVLELQMPITARKSFMASYHPDDMPSGYPSLPKHVDDVINAAPWDPLVSVRRHLIYYPWLYRGAHYLPTYPLLTPVPQLLNSWPEYILHRPDLLYGTWPWPFYPENVLPYRRRYPITQPDLGSDSRDKELHDKVDQQLDEYESLKRHRRRKVSSSSSSSSSSDSSDVEEEDLILSHYPLVADKGVNTKESIFRRRVEKERPEWKKYWPQTPQPRNHHQPDFHRRRPGMYNTWVEPEFGSLEGPLNTSSMYQNVGDGMKVKSDREKLMSHLKTPYIEMPEYSTYTAQLGRNDLPVHRHQERMQHLRRRDTSTRIQAFGDKENNAFLKARHIEDTKRQQALMRIGSDVEKQQQYEKKLYDTIDAKRKINQSFRNSFFQKELDHINRQQSHADWLQQRRNKYTQQYLDTVHQRQAVEDSRQLGRQYRQARHHAETVRRFHEAEGRKSMATLGSA